MVQGTAKLPDEIEPQIENVMANIVPKKLAEMTSAEFDAFKQSYEKQLLEPPLGLDDEVAYFWPVAARGNVCPDKALQLLRYLREDLTSKDQLIEAWRRLITVKPQDKIQRSRVVVKYFSDTLGPVPKAPTTDEYVKDLMALNVPQSAINLAMQEGVSATILSKVDSTSRAELIKKGATFYPQEIKCTGSKGTQVALNDKSAFMKKNQIIEH